MHLDLTHALAGPNAGLIILLLVCVGVLGIIVHLWMLFDALRNGFFFWAFFILFGGIALALLYYFLVYQASKGESSLGDFLQQMGAALVLALVVIVLPAAWMVHDGLHDVYGHADAGLVPGDSTEIHDGVLATNLTAKLDQAAKLYVGNAFPIIIVSGVALQDNQDEADAMAAYLEAHNVPAAAIIEEHRGDQTHEAMAGTTGTLSDQLIHSVIIIDDYYRLPHLKLNLRRRGNTVIGQVHVGEWNINDAVKVLNELGLIYGDYNRQYLVPLLKQAIEKQKKFVDSLKGVKNNLNRGLDPSAK